MEEKKEHEESLYLELKYVCPECEHEGEAKAPYIWKTFKGVKSRVRALHLQNNNLGAESLKVLCGMLPINV